MRILYGVAGEGMGHATRSHAFLTDIVADHDVLIVASGRAHDYLAKHFPQVREILGFSLAYEDNAIRRWETVAQNLRGAVSGWPAQVRSFYEIARDFSADVVVSDFESFVLTVARRERVPAISVDNIMMLDRCRHDDGIIRGDTDDDTGWCDDELAAAMQRRVLAERQSSIQTRLTAPKIDEPAVLQRSG